MIPVGDSASDDPAGPEISDLIVDHDPDTLARRPVARERVVETLRAAGRRRAARIAERLPARAGVLDPDAVDRVLVAAHLELQRLHEEFASGWRLHLILRAVIEALRARSAPPYRVVDVGCGLGYIVRWLAARGRLGDDVELVGVDLNGCLARAAQALAGQEQLRCRFEVASAIRLERPATVFISTGALHHFRGGDLPRFFAGQVAAGARAFVHLDIKPTWAAPVGAWLFHTARMRVPLARHDGVVSALRAHSSARLDAAMQEGAPRLVRGLFDADQRLLAIARVMQAAIGVDPELAEPFTQALGPAASRMRWTPS
ncbi:MAG TPA: class I SAM-dependent methyltransferase [Kofleriaceae bacterium]|nr:class I SAM-dependent methyltransferase [Kofleriaceae bacterium]